MRKNHDHVIEYRGKNFRVLSQSDQVGFKGEMTYVKRELNRLFAHHCLGKGDTVLDAYAGYGITTYDWLSSGAEVTAIERNQKTYACLEENLHGPVGRTLTLHRADNRKVIKQLVASGERFNLVDLDPFGNAYEQTTLALPLIDRGFLWLTSGEHINMRRNWNRDVLVARYGEGVLQCYEDKASIPTFPKIIESHIQSVRDDARLVMHVMSHASARMLFTFGTKLPKTLERKFSSIPRYYGHLAISPSSLPIDQGL